MILHVISDFTMPNGAERMLIRLLNHGAHERAIVASMAGMTESNRNLVTNPLVRFEFLDTQSPRSIFKAVSKLRSLIVEERPTVILAWMYHAMVVSTIAQRLSAPSTPVYWNVRQSLDDPSSLSRSTRRAVAACKLLSRFPRATIYNSQRALDLHLQYGFRDHKSIVIPNGFEMPGSVAIRPTRAETFGIAGRQHPQKDFRTFFRAAAQVAQKNPKVRFVVAGMDNTEDNPEVMSMIAEAGLPLHQVELRGPVSDISGFYRNIDMLILSSRTEGFPNVVAEAMSHGKPVITTDVGDAATIVGDSGIVVPPRDVDALRVAIEQAIDLSPQDYMNRAERARDRIGSVYSIASIAGQYREILKPCPELDSGVI